jgi:hypothetical protein
MISHFGLGFNEAAGEILRASPAEAQSRFDRTLGATVYPSRRRVSDAPRGGENAGSGSPAIGGAAKSKKSKFRGATSASAHSSVDRREPSQCESFELPRLSSPGCRRVGRDRARTRAAVLMGTNLPLADRSPPSLVGLRLLKRGNLPDTRDSLGRGRCGLLRPAAKLVIAGRPLAGTRPP